MCLAVPGRVESIFEDNGTRMGKVDFGGVIKNVCLAYLPDIQVGDYTIVHVGFAISKIDEREAEEIFSYIQQIGELAEGDDPFAVMQPQLDGDPDAPASD